MLWTNYHNHIERTWEIGGCARRGVCYSSVQHWSPDSGPAPPASRNLAAAAASRAAIGIASALETEIAAILAAVGIVTWSAQASAFATLLATGTEIWIA